MNTQPSPTVTRDDVVRVLRRDFPQHSESDALAVLDQYGTAKWERERDRVQLAILKLANRDFDSLKLHTEAARCDYRDVLAPAEYPAYSKHRFRTPFGPGESAKLYEKDWDQYQQWLARK